ncbi:MAG: isoleucine--tRNA ligase [Ignavibacteria bacterium]|nr:isoleucine--tRNA ligase [Ignavibacteria bacterium]
MFKELAEKLSYPEIEHKILEFWEENKIFEKTLENRKDSPFYAFYEGPPTVNGEPGIHHLMARTLKDIVCRYKTLSGYYVRRQAGWDTHGLPVEITVEKKLGLKNKSDVLEYGIDRFNKECKKFVYENIEKDLGWRQLTTRMGYWVDLDSAYITCTNDYIESVWWALKQYFDKGLIYKGFKVVPQSPTIETPLSSHELSLGYKEVRDPNCYIKLKVRKSNLDLPAGTSLLVWTTTPWTLLANVALAVGEDIDYVLVKNKVKQKEFEQEMYLILAESRLSVLDGESEIISTFKGKELLGTKYEQIFSYKPLDEEKYPNALSVLLGDFVSTEDGSGIVHIAPAFGEDDYQMSRKFDLPFEQPVSPNGHFTEDAGEFAGRAIKNFTYPDRKEEGSDKDIIIALKKADKIYRATNDYLHNYPHCWRTGNPIMYYARDSWFIKSPAYKEQMIEINKNINWQPSEIGTGRFGNWLEEVKEWSLSRDRYWGTPLPIWVSEDESDMFAIGSIEELLDGYFENPDGTRTRLRDGNYEIDLHKPFVDNIVFVKNGKTYRRISEVIDVWFDSGSMPFAQMHYPFENKELFEKMFPGDFIAEGIDQTRGWFYTLHNIAVAIFNKPAFKNIIVNELILDKAGVKMSKSKGNSVDPFYIMGKYGADAARWYLIVNTPPWKTMLFNEDDIARTVISDFFRSLTNIYSFFAMYANIDGFTGKEAFIQVSERTEIDRWIISKTNSLIASYTQYMEDYDLTKAFRLIQDFTINELSNWYIRRNRRRFWKGEKDKDKIAAYQTLREVLLNLLCIMSPAAPFLSEDLYLKLKSEGGPISIHLLDLPKADESLIDVDLERKMELSQRIVSIARFLREKSKIKVRQPLSKILIPIQSIQERRDILHFENIIREEINVKSIEFVEGDTEIVRRSAKANFKVIGKKFGKQTQNVANAIKELTNQQIKQIEKQGSISLPIQGEQTTISLEDIEILSQDIEGWLVESDGTITVALDTQINEELLSEGIAREFINRVQNLRKQSNFDITDRIAIKYNSSNSLKPAVEKMKDFIANEVLAQQIEFSEQNEKMTELEINDEKIFVYLNKV